MPQVIIDDALIQLAVRSKENLEEALVEAYKAGMVAGIQKHSWSEAGVDYVGNRTLLTVSLGEVE